MLNHRLLLIELYKLRLQIKVLEILNVLILNRRMKMQSFILSNKPSQSAIKHPQIRR